MAQTGPSLGSKFKENHLLNWATPDHAFLYKGVTKVGELLSQPIHISHSGNQLRTLSEKATDKKNDGRACPFNKKLHDVI